jgi:hypothetical protein
MKEAKLKWGIKLENYMQRVWSVGMCLSHYHEETYLYISFFKWTIIIGKFYH